MESFRTLSNIKIVDLTNNSLKYLSSGTFSDTQAKLMFSKEVYCCYLVSKESNQCSVSPKLHRQNYKCQIIVESYRTQLGLIIFSATALIINIILLLIGYNKSKNIHNILSSYLKILNLFPPTYTLILIIIFIHHYGNHVNFSVTFPFGLTCLSLQIIAMCGIFLSQYTRFLIAVNHVLVTRYVFKRRPLTTRQGLLCSILGWCVSLGLVFLGYTSTNDKHYSCFPMLYDRKENLHKRADIWIYGVISTISYCNRFSICVSILRFVNDQDKKFGRKRGSKMLTKTIITIAIELEMYILVGAILILYYNNSNSFHIVLLVCFTMICQSVLPTLYELYQIMTLTKK